MQYKKNVYCVILLLLWEKYRTKSTLKMEEAFRHEVGGYSSPRREIVVATWPLAMRAWTLASCLHCVVADEKQRGLLMLYCLAHFSFIWYRTQAFRLVFKFRVDLQPKQNFSGKTFTNMLRILSPEWFYSVPSCLK